MRIVNSQQFLALPAGTVFVQSETDWCEASLQIKDVSTGANAYFCSTQLRPWALLYDVACPDTLEFLVFEPSDVASLIVRLTKALNDSGCSPEELIKLLGEASAANTLDGVEA